MVNFTGYSKEFPLLIDILTKGKSLKKFEDRRYVFLDNDKKKKKKEKSKTRENLLSKTLFDSRLLLKHLKC